MSQAFTYDEILEAYIKLKTYIYYDSNNLYLRKQLAIFETNDVPLSTVFRINKIYNTSRRDKSIPLYEWKLEILTTAINEYHIKPDFFNFFLTKITAKFLPKSIEDQSKNDKIISNKRTLEEYKILRSSVFIDAPIEIHLISVLWILKIGATIDHKLSKNCFGNRLVLNRKGNKVVQGSGLFKPYPKQYQKWRDTAVSTAKKSLEDGNNVALLNLDIRDFFYSVRIPVETFSNWKSDFSEHFRAENNLIDIFTHIHESFTIKIAQRYNTPYDFDKEIVKDNTVTHFILPIGLLSSFVLANDHLKKFDSRIISKYRPIYYGRYVDDIIIVLTNPILGEKDTDEIDELNFDFTKYQKQLSKLKYHDDDGKLSESNFKTLNDLEQFVLRNLYPLLTLVDTPNFLNSTAKESERVFKLNGFPRLYCQSDKTLLYYFDKDESSLVIDKLKKDLDEKSSEFRNYDDIDENEDFEESAYHLLYDGTEGKIRTLKDYKEDKFGLSVYLSKKIFKARRRADKVVDGEAEKLVKFFRGVNTLNLYTLWEKAFAFLLINNKPITFVQFYFNCREIIENIVLSDTKIKIKNDEYKGHVYEYLQCAFELTLSLNPSFIEDSEEALMQYEFLSNQHQYQSQVFDETYILRKNYGTKKYRDSNLIRHHYVAQTLLNYTDNINHTLLKLPL